MAMLRKDSTPGGCPLVGGHRCRRGQSFQKQFYHLVECDPWYKRGQRMTTGDSCDNWST